MPRKKMRPLPSQEQLNELFDYNKTTGVLRWKIDKSPKARRGNMVGTYHNIGYMSTTINRKQYWLHRVIWKLVTGQDPEKCIDHINGNRADNSWSNLRQAEMWQNNSNRKTDKRNKHGLHGVTFHKVNKIRPWEARIQHKSKSTLIGYFNCPLMAQLAYHEKARELHGSFASRVFSVA